MLLAATGPLWSAVSQAAGCMMVVCVAWLRAEPEVWQRQLALAVLTSYSIGCTAVLRGEAVAFNLQQVWSQTWRWPLSAHAVLRGPGAASGQQEDIVDHRWC